MPSRVSTERGAGWARSQARDLWGDGHLLFTTAVHHSLLTAQLPANLLVHSMGKRNMTEIHPTSSQEPTLINQV
jgi:hypothetical protein